MKHPLSYVAAGSVISILLSLAAAAFKHQSDNPRCYVFAIVVLLALLVTQVLQLYLHARKLKQP